MSAIAEKAKEVLSKRILAGGELVTDEHYDARITRCKTLMDGQPCPFFGAVSVFGLVFDEGCRACGCPAATKFRMKTVTDPIIAGAIKVMTGGNAVIDCAHPDGSMWKDIEEQFNKQKT